MRGRWLNGWASVCTQAWYVVPGAEDPLATFEEVMLDVHGVHNTVGVTRGAVRPVTIDRLREVARHVLPPPLAALVGMTADPYPQALVDTASSRMAYGRIALIGDAAFTGKKMVLCCFPLFMLLKMMIIPRQARDKHRESTQKQIPLSRSAADDRCGNHKGGHQRHRAGEVRKRHFCAILY